MSGIISNPLRTLRNLAPTGDQRSGRNALLRWHQRIWAPVSNVDQPGSNRNDWAGFSNPTELSPAATVHLSAKIVSALCKQVDQDPEARDKLADQYLDLETCWSTELGGQQSSLGSYLSFIVRKPAFETAMRFFDERYQPIDAAKVDHLQRSISTILEVLSAIEHPDQVAVAAATRNYLAGEILPLLLRTVEIERVLIPPELIDEYQSGLTGRAVSLALTGQIDAARDLRDIAIDLAIVATGVVNPPAGVGLSVIRAFDTGTSRDRLRALIQYPLAENKVAKRDR